MRKTLTTIAAAAAAIAASAGFALTAQASTPAAAQPAGAVHACVLPTGHLDFLQFRTANYGKCASGDAAWTWGQQGAQGPSGVVSTGTHDLGGIASVPTGGGFVANATQAGTIDLPAGTYLISVSAKVTPTMTSSVQVFPQIFVYNQAANASFTGDLLNVGAGALESGGNTSIDSYQSGSGQVTLATATTLHVYAFGYDSDRGAGSYALDDLTVTATQVTPAKLTVALPIEKAARRAIAHAGHVLADGIEHDAEEARQAWDEAITRHFPHARYHPEQTPTSPEAPPMSLIATLEDDFAEVRDKVEEFAKSKLPTALSDIKKVEGSDLFAAVVGAAHVPPEFLSVATNFINELAAKFPKDAESSTASEPVSDDVPQPVAAGPVVAGQA